MNIDAVLKDLAAERVADLVPLLRRAYELGYREGMASTGQAVPPQPVAIAVPPPVAAPSSDGGVAIPPTAPPVPQLESADARESDEDDDDADDDESEEVEKPSYPTVRASSTIGGLLRKIERVFRLEERFELVVRIENPTTGRALPRNVRLSSYARHDD